MVLWASRSVVPKYPRILRRRFVDDDVGYAEWRERFYDNCTSVLISALKERLCWICPLKRFLRRAYVLPTRQE
jgi:hypothetical protein